MNAGIQDWKDIAEALQATVTSVGLILAGIWTYHLFVKKREPFPKANVEHKAVHWRLESRIVLHLTVRITNVSAVVLAMPSMMTRVQKLQPMSSEAINEITSAELPMGESEVPWPLLAERRCDWSTAKREIEPGETEEFHFDFLLPPEVALVSVYSYVKNHSKRHREIGWNTTTVHSLRQGVINGTAENATSNRTRAPEEESATAATAAQEGKAVDG